MVEVTVPDTELAFVRLEDALTFGFDVDNNDDFTHPAFPWNDTGVHPPTAAPRVPT
ncbi:MAG: hypothetical protein L0H81_08845 [Actinomyces sp.]|nr:hypothetical protein [Actinomyces sp.]